MIRKLRKKFIVAAMVAVFLVLFLLSFMFIVNSSYNPFIYFRF